jgi:serine/threonine protein kinase
MTTFFVNGKRLTIDARKSLGKGMEADVYLVDNRAVKIFKDPSHPDLLTNFDRKVAKQKIDEHQDKLKRFPRGLPPHVVAPIDLVSNQSGIIVGYTMDLVHNAKQIRTYGQVAERVVGIDPNLIVKVFADLRETVKSLHLSRVVIGDFNDLNILVSGDNAYIIDADSFQFGGFLCRMFTEEFVDPRLCDINGNSPILKMAHDPDSDWYAYTVMFFKTLLCVGPFGGVYKPSKKKDVVLHSQRSLKRISVFNPEVTYPKKAIHYKVLPDDLLHYFQEVFDKGKRIEFPANLVASVRWTKCSTCGTEHARGVCPNCQIAPPAAVKETVVVNGKIKSTTVFKTSGSILYSTMQSGKLYWLYSEGGKFRREDRCSVVDGFPELDMRFRISGEDTIIGKGNEVVVVRKSGGVGRIRSSQYQNKFAMFDGSSAGLFWIQDGVIVRGNPMGLDYEPSRIGQVLDGQTIFWVGDSLGAGFYRAGELCVFFVFDTNRGGINDSVKLPRIGGQLLGARCLFSVNKIAMMFSFKDGSKVTNRCVFLRATGEVIGTSEHSEGDGSWLSEIRGKCIVGDSIFSATDNGIVKVDFSSGVISKETIFEGSENFVDNGSHLFIASNGLFCVGRKEVRLLQVCR